MSKFSVGDVIKNKDGHSPTILAIRDGLYALSAYTNKELVSEEVTEQYLINGGYELAEKGRWKPKMEAQYKVVDSGGSFSSKWWTNHELDNFRFNTGNCFHPDDKEGLEGYRIKLLELGK